jgi:hypothetical protein
MFLRQRITKLSGQFIGNKNISTKGNVWNETRRVTSHERRHGGTAGNMHGRGTIDRV